MTAPTSYERATDLVVAIIKSVENTGIVYDHLVMARDEWEFIQAFKAKVAGVDQYRGWMVTSPREPSKGSTTDTILQTIEFKLFGYRGINESGIVGTKNITGSSSEREFYALTERLSDALTRHIRAGDAQDASAGEYVRLTFPATIERRGWATFGKVACHFAELSYVLQIEKGVTFVI